MLQIQPIKTRIFKENENLLAFLKEHVKTLPEKTVVIVTSKIVALSEGRTAVIENARTKERLIRAESDMAVETKYVWLTVKDGMLMASAGIDESNAQGKLILLPKDSFKAADLIRTGLKKLYGVKDIGVILTDSRTIPFRSGVNGVALGYAGYRGTADLFGRKLTFSKTNMADGLATAAVIVMGEGDECQPLALITGAPVEFQETIDKSELHIDIEDDMYKPILTQFGS